MKYITGTQGTDYLYGTAGSDYINGSGGCFDILEGNGGKDVYVVHHFDFGDGWTDAKTFIYGWMDGTSLLDLSNTPVSSFDEIRIVFEYDTDIVHADYLYGLNGEITGKLDPMRIYLNTLDGSKAVISADDFIFADTPQHWLTNAADRVTWSGTEAYSVFYGQDGQDTVDLASARGAEVGVGFSVDLVKGRIDGGQNVQHIFEFEHVEGSRGQDIIIGNADSNRLSGGDNYDQIWGGQGSDFIAGNRGTDALYGGDGADTLAGGLGVDKLWGGAGRDTFVMRSETRADQIRDFEAGDVIDVSAWDVTGGLTFKSTRAGEIQVTDGTHVVCVYGDLDALNSDVFVF